MTNAKRVLCVALHVKCYCISTHTRVKVWKKSAACIQKQVVSLSAHLLDMRLLLLLLLRLTIASCYS